MKSAALITGLPLASAPDKKPLIASRAAIVAAQAKCVGPHKTRLEHEAKLDEVRAEIAGIETHLDPCNDALVEKLQARKTQVRLIEDAIVALDAKVEAAEHALRMEFGTIINTVIRPVLGGEHETVLQEVTKAIRPLVHDDGEAHNFARQLPIIGDFELFSGCSWWGSAPLEEATQRTLEILDALSRGENPFRFNNGL